MPRRTLVPVRLAALLFLGACTVGPNYKTPDIPTPPAYLEAGGKPAAPVSATTAATPDLKTWWSQFRDPELDSLVTRAMTDNLPAKPLYLMLVCGEPSGDQLGGQLMAALKAATNDTIRIDGVGGRMMEAQGLQSLYPVKDTAVMGLREVVPRIPLILRRVREVCDHALATRPDAVVLIDAPDFTHRIARQAMRHFKQKFARS